MLAGSLFLYHEADESEVINLYGNFFQGNPDPYQQRLDAMQRQMIPRLDIIHVNGENGARSFRMAPNSNALLLDDSAPVVWLVQSDGAGYHTATPYTIAPMEQVQPEDTIKAFETRLSRLEAMINESYSQQTGTEQSRTAATE